MTKQSGGELNIFSALLQDAPHTPGDQPAFLRHRRREIKPPYQLWSKKMPEKRNPLVIYLPEFTLPKLSASTRIKGASAWSPCPIKSASLFSAYYFCTLHFILYLMEVWLWGGREHDLFKHLVYCRRSLLIVNHRYCCHY